MITSGLAKGLNMDKYSIEINSILNQLTAIKSLYFQQMYNVETNIDGSFKKIEPMGYDWVSREARDCFVLLTQRLTYLISKQAQRLDKRRTHNEQ